jgi:hypothetical protein
VAAWWAGKTSNVPRQWTEEGWILLRRLLRQTADSMTLLRVVAVVVRPRRMRHLVAHRPHRRERRAVAGEGSQRRVSTGLG